MFLLLLHEGVFANAVRIENSYFCCFFSSQVPPVLGRLGESGCSSWSTGIFANSKLRGAPGRIFQSLGEGSL